MKPCAIEQRALEGQFLQAANALADQPGLQTRQETEASLTVPFADAALRLRLIENSRAIDQQLARKNPADKPFPINPDLQRAAVMDAAQRQGRAALAVLGQRLFDEQNAGKDGERFELVAHRLELFPAEQSWWESLGRAGDQVGRRVRRLSDDAAARLEEARKDDVDHARTALRGAERESRLLDGSEGMDWEAEPAVRFLHLSTHDLLLWQTRRTLEDHWFGENGEPYYQKAGLAYLEDARRLVGPAQAAQSVGPVEEELNRPGRLTLAPAGPLVLTSETELSFECALAPATGGTAPTGLPSFHLEADSALKAAFPDGRFYRVADLRPGRPTEPIAAVVSRADAALDGDGRRPRRRINAPRSRCMASSAASRSKPAWRWTSNPSPRASTTPSPRRAAGPSPSGPTAAYRKSTPPPRAPSQSSSTVPAAWGSMKATRRRRASSRL